MAESAEKMVREAEKPGDEEADSTSSPRFSFPLAPGPESAFSNLQDAHRCIRDIIALSTLPAMWTGAKPLRIAESLLAVIDTTIRPRFSYIRLGSQCDDGEPIELAHIDGSQVSAEIAAQIGRKVSVDADGEATEGEREINVAPLDEPLHVFTASLGYDAGSGVLAAGFANEEKGECAPPVIRRALLNIAANQATTACKNVALQQQAERARQETQALYEVSRTLAAELDLESVLQKTTDAATRLTHAKFGAFFYNLLNEKGESYMLFTLSGAPRSAFERFGMPRNTPLFDHTFRGRGPVRLADVKADTRYGKVAPHFGMPSGHLPVRSYLAVPVLSRTGEVLGGLFFGHPDPGVFTEAHERLAVGIASHAAVAIDNARLFAKAEQEIARRKRVEDALRQSEERLRLAVDGSNGGEWSVALDPEQPSRFADAMHISSRLKGFIGFEDHEFPNSMSAWLERVHPEDLPLIRASAQAHLEGRAPWHSVEYRIRHRDGGWRWISSTGRLWKSSSDSGAPIWAGVDWDVTEERLAQEALRESEERLRTAAEAAEFGTYELDLVTGENKWSDRLKAIFGLPPESPTPPDPVAAGLIHPDDATRVRAKMLACFDPSGDGLFEDEHRIIRPGGEVRWVVAKGRTIFTGEGAQRRGVRSLGAVIDITNRKHAEQALHESQRQLATLMSNLPGMAYRCPAEPPWPLTFVSGGVLGLTGRTAEDFMQNRVTWLDVMHPDDVVHVEKEIETALREKRIFSMTYRIFHASGEIRWVLDRGQPVYDHHGTLTGFEGFVGDLTDRVRAEEAQRRQAAITSAITDNAATAVFMMDANSRCTFMNPAAERMTGFTLEQVRGGILHDFIHHHHPDGRPYPVHECPIDRALPESFDVVDHEDVFIRRNGEFFPVLVNAKPIRQEDVPAGTVIEVRDITLQKQAQERVYNLLNDLRDADRRKDEFLAMLAHELRNPLAPLRIALDLLRNTRDNPTKFDEISAMMNRQVSQLVRLIDDLLDVSRITRGKITLRKERTQLATVINQALEACRPLANPAGHDVQVSLPDQAVWLEADPVRLTQVFSNLLNNACKYTPRGGTIRVAARREGDQVRVTVKDNGSGIPADQLDSIFELFAQVDRSLERAQGGLGIGLTLVKRLVELHGGSVSAYSAGEGKGSEFTVRLPVLAENEMSVTIATSDAPASNSRLPQEPGDSNRRPCGHRILIVDDNADAAQTLSLMLQSDGHQTRIAYDGRQAIEMASEFLPEVILLDIGLPKVNGYDVCRAVRREPWGREMLIVALTGWGQQDDRRNSREAGFDCHMVKPLDPQQFNQLLQGLNV